MSDTLKVLLGFLLIGLLPGVVLGAIVDAYGRRRRWGPQRFAWGMVIVAVAWSAVFGLWVLDVPPIRVAVFSTLLFVVGLAYARGLAGWADYFRQRRSGVGKK